MISRVSEHPVTKDIEGSFFQRSSPHSKILSFEYTTKGLRIYSRSIVSL